LGTAGGAYLGYLSGTGPAGVLAGAQVGQQVGGGFGAGGGQASRNGF
jgi:hypothetical protein